MLRISALVALVALVAVASATVYFEEDFSSDPFAAGKWTKSSWKSGEMGEWAWTAGEWHTNKDADKGLQTTEDMKHHAISIKMPQKVSNKGKDIVLQFTAKNERKETSFCGGGYIKLLPSGLDQESFGGDSPYSIMFGPDLCGYDVSRIHVIFTDKSGKNLLKTDEVKLEYADKDEFTHLYTLIVKPDHTYQVLFDNKEKAAGKIIDGWAFPPKTKDDPEDKKPADWVDEKEIVDPEDKKPEGYDDIPQHIADPAATKPDEWDDELDGEWEPAMIENPEYKGEWKPKMITNPAYKGEWKPKQIDNADYYEDVATYEDLEYLGFELWTVNNGTIFDNIVVTDDAEYAKEVAEKTWKATSEGEKAAKEAWTKSKEPAKEESKEDAATEEVSADEDDKPKKDEL